MSQLNEIKGNPMSAVLAYIPIIGWVYVWTACKDDELAVFHVKQSVSLFITAALVPIVWVIFGLIVTLIPFIGPIAATATFGIVMAAMILIVISWLMGIRRAWRGKMLKIPMTGPVSKRLYGTN